MKRYKVKLSKLEEVEQVGLVLLRNGYTVTLVKEKIDGKRTFNYYLEYYEREKE